MTRDKRVLWDADFYKSLPDEYCLYCLTKKQIYLIGQALLPQMQWNTRWVGDTSDLDIKAIGAEIEGIISMDECGNVGNIINLLNDLQLQVIALQQTVENGGIPPVEMTDDINTPTYLNTSEDLSRPVGDLIPSACDTTELRDKLYGACNELAKYIVQQHTDFFEISRQTISSLPEKLAGIVSAIPIIETLPLDEAIGLAAYLAEEAEDLWQATVTEDRIQDFACLLFCAAIANDCVLTPEVIISAMKTEIPTTTHEYLVAGIRDTIAFLILNQPVGDEFFYSNLYWQLQAVLLGERFINATGWRPYEMRYLAGYNSPDNDWSIFCDECPDFGYYIDYRFWTDDYEPWEIISGTYELEYFEGEVSSDSGVTTSWCEIHLTLPEPQTFKLYGVGVHFDVNRDCGITSMSVRTSLNGVATQGWSVSPAPNGFDSKRTWSVSQEINAFDCDHIEIDIVAKRCSAPDALTRIQGVRIWVDSLSERKGLLTLEPPLGQPSNGGTSLDFWEDWGA